jgi:pyrroloquinoline quinone biosynthesis protein D
MTELPVVTMQSVPTWARGVRLRYDETRENWVIVSPERVSMLNQSATEILKLIDGERSATQMVDELVAHFHAPREIIEKDVLHTLQDMQTRGLITC